MAKKTYKFTYGFAQAELAFEVDTEKFTPELANETLDFFSWDYDEEADPVDEVLKKYALEVLRVGSPRQSAKGIVRMWDQEGFATIDGEMGITLIDYDGFEFLENDLEMEVVNG